MSAIGDLRVLGVEVYHCGEGLRVRWHCEPTPELRALLLARKPELLQEMAPVVDSWLDHSVPTDPDAIAEYSGFSSIERETWAGCRAVRLDLGEPRDLAERSAAADVLWGRKVRTPLAPAVVRALLIEKARRQQAEQVQPVTTQAASGQTLEASL